ncbi:MAG: hypothetical protein A4E19_04035 [Nitrospira sp. SG-bin1]|nr:MAG: hypothetical protein A4E19_04035 [Nitrospira sp. SG-bin1]
MVDGNIRGGGLRRSLLRRSDGSSFKECRQLLGRKCTQNDAVRERDLTIRLSLISGLIQSNAQNNLSFGAHHLTDVGDNNLGADTIEPNA